MTRVEYGEEFVADLEREVEYLRRLAEFGWIQTLAEDLDDIGDMLGAFPLLGHVLAREGADALLKLRLRRAPFYVWYSYREETAEQGLVTLLRLFHTRQRTPEPRLP